VISFLETRRNRKGPNQESKEEGGPQPCFYWPKIAALTKHCALAHYHGGSTSPGSTIIPDVFSRLPTLEIATPPGSSAG
jgi:hypothetical protein